MIHPRIAEPPRADEDARRRLLNMHVKTAREWQDGYPAWICAECSQPWPCRTREALQAGAQW